MTDTAVQDWLAVHRELLNREAAFTDVAIRAALGQITMDELSEQRRELVDLRERCSAAYELAFPRSATDPGEEAVRHPTK